MTRLPRLVIAAPSSGAGKTTVATGLMAAWRQAGLAVSPHKVGPDYIDPSYHALAAGRPGRNLDPLLVGPERIVPLLLHGAQGADVAVVEGVMGLFDGRGATDDGSTAHVARLLEAPVVLVVDAASQSRSVAALVAGFRDFDPRVRLAGVILNRVGSDRHEQLLREALTGTVPVVGVLRRDAAVAVPSRHLGLVPAAERSPEAVATVERLGVQVAAGCDLSALQQIACSADALTGEPWAPEPKTSEAVLRDRPVVALAGGAAFSFAYTETAETLTAAGAQVVMLDPLREEQLPAATAAVVLPGGFPEVYAEQLSANLPLLAALRRHLAAGAPLYAECAGLLLLCTALDGAPMVGQFEATATMTPRLTLGYRAATAPADTLAVSAGTTVTGHEFHRTAVDPGSGSEPAWTIEDRAEGFATGTRVLASYLHLHPAGVPSLAHRLVGAANRSRVGAP